MSKKIDDILQKKGLVPANTGQVRDKEIDNLYNKYQL
jgi:hypothetical protein